MVFLVLSFGCEEDLDLRAEHPSSFSLYGVLSPDRDTQSVQLYVINSFPELRIEEDHNISLTSTNLSTGDIVIWQDSIVTNNNVPAIIFWAPFTPKHEESYFLEATRPSDGAYSSVTVTIPPPVTVGIEENISLTPGMSELQVNIEAEQIRALKPELEYEVFGRFPEFGGTIDGPIRTYVIPYETKEFTTDSGWAILSDFMRDQIAVQKKYILEIRGEEGIRCGRMVLVALRLHVLVGDATWDPPGGVCDPNVLSYQTALSNVDNGFGFVGAGFRIVEEIYPSTEIQQDACYTNN